MSNRKCSLRLGIDNGVRRIYCVRPLAAADLPTPFVVGFKLTERTQQPNPEYLVRLAANGAVNCSCPQWQRGAEKCKHADALIAAGLLPVALVQLLAERTKLLDLAEQTVRNRDLEREAACRNADSMRATIGQLKEQLEAVSARALQLQTALGAEIATTPKRPRRKAA